MPSKDKNVALQCTPPHGPRMEPKLFSLPHRPRFCVLISTASAFLTTSNSSPWKGSQPPTVPQPTPARPLGLSHFLSPHHRG